MRKNKAGIESSLRTHKHTHTQNKLSMEERISTMPCVYHRNFRILRTCGLRQTKTWRVEYISPRRVVCPQCRSSTLKLYDHYSRQAAFINDEGARRTLLIKAKRYKCQHCTYLFREPIEGLLPKKRSSEQYRQAIAHEYIKTLTTKPLPSSLTSLKAQWSASSTSALNSKSKKR